MAATLEGRLERLGKAIAAAQAKLAAHQDFKDFEVGDFLATVNKDLEEVSHDDEAAAHAAYDRIEARLAELQPMLASLPR